MTRGGEAKESQCVTQSGCRKQAALTRFAGERSAGMVSPYWVCSANLVKACGMVTTSSMYKSKKPDTVQTVQGGSRLVLSFLLHCTAAWVARTAGPQQQPHNETSPKVSTLEGLYNVGDDAARCQLLLRREAQPLLWRTAACDCCPNQVPEGVQTHRAGECSDTRGSDCGFTVQHSRQQQRSQCRGLGCSHKGRRYTG